MQAGQVVGPDNHCERLRVADNLIVNVLLWQRIQSLATELTLQPEAPIARRTLDGHVIAQVGSIHRKTIVANATIGLAIGRAHIGQAGQGSAKVEMYGLPLDGAHSRQFLYADTIVEVVKVVWRRNELQSRILRN